MPPLAKLDRAELCTSGHLKTVTGEDLRYPVQLPPRAKIKVELVAKAEFPIRHVEPFTTAYLDRRLDVQVIYDEKQMKVWADTGHPAVANGAVQGTATRSGHDSLEHRRTLATGAGHQHLLASCSR